MLEVVEGVWCLMWGLLVGEIGHVCAWWMRLDMCAHDLWAVGSSGWGGRSGGMRCMCG